MRASSKRSAIAVVVAFVIVSTFAAISGGTLRGIPWAPAHLRVSEGQEFSIDTRLPWSGALVADPADSLLMNSAAGGTVSMTPSRPGTATVDIKLFNVIPVRRYVVDVVPEMRVMVGGQSIGILLASQGVAVMGLYPVVGVDGGRYCPGRDAGIAVGDWILSVDGTAVSDSIEMEYLVNEAGQKGREAVLRVATGRGLAQARADARGRGRDREISVKPIRCEDGFKLGIYVRDNAAGVGTLTFWHPGSLRFGALGHVVADVNTGREVPITDGRIVWARVAGIDMGGAGRPGEKIGTFAGMSDNIGVVDDNSSVGICGSLIEPLENGLYPEPIPVALASAVHEGPAEMLTVIAGSTIERFSVDIVKVTKQTRPSGKGMIIEVTDPRLIERTGGIVQGMSGSPIIQDGKLVGAVTHVFVSDPMKGYGVFAEYMLDAAGLLSDAGLEPRQAS